MAPFQPFDLNVRIWQKTVHHTVQEAWHRCFISFSSAVRHFCFTWLMMSGNSFYQIVQFLQILNFDLVYPYFWMLKKTRFPVCNTKKGNLAVQHCWTSERVYQLIYKLIRIYYIIFLLSILFLFFFLEKK